MVHHGAEGKVGVDVPVGTPVGGGAKGGGAGAGGGTGGNAGADGNPKAGEGSGTDAGGGGESRRMTELGPEGGAGLDAGAATEAAGAATEAARASLEKAGAEGVAVEVEGAGGSGVQHDDHAVERDGNIDVGFGGSVSAAIQEDWPREFSSFGGAVAGLRGFSNAGAVEAAARMARVEEKVDWLAEAVRGLLELQAEAMAGRERGAGGRGGSQGARPPFWARPTRILDACVWWYVRV